MCVCMSMRKRLAPEKEDEVGRGPREEEEEQHVEDPEELEDGLEAEAEGWMVRAVGGFILGGLYG
jgi:hypothetical protein